MSSNVSTLSGRLPAELGNAVSDVLHGAISKGMAPDEACCVALAVICDYARTSYGDLYLNQLKRLVEAQKGKPLPALTA